MTRAFTRIFLSVDLVGSTEWKHSRETSGQQWTQEFFAFYQEFPAYFEMAWRESKARHALAADIPEGDEPPRLWKAVGDELVFQGVVTCEESISVAVDGWQVAMRHMHADLADKTKLTVKGAAWTGTFPVPDREVAFPLSVGKAQQGFAEWSNHQLLKMGVEDSDYRLDFLGPSIDIGFRIAGKSTKERFVISAEVAYSLAKLDASINPPRHLIHYDGEVDLKGVWSGHGYPIFWLSAQPSDEKFGGIDVLAGRQPAATVQPMLIIQAVEPLLKDDKWPTCLYLPKSGRAEIRDPTKHRLELRWSELESLAAPPDVAKDPRRAEELTSGQSDVAELGTPPRD